MYTQIWNKYLPIIKILLKKSVNGEQTLAMNVTDFERAGMGRKTGYKFNIQFNNGKVDNIISTSVLAKDLAAILLQDEMVKDLFARNNYYLNMNAKYQLGIKHVPKEVLAPETTEATETTGM